jgi:hypothetical protein
MEMTDEMQTHDGDGEQFLSEQGVRCNKFNDMRSRDKRIKEMREELGEYVEQHTALRVPDHRLIDNEYEKDGYLHTAERFTHESLDKNEFITVYTNQVDAFVSLGEIRRAYEGELIDERQVSYDDEKTVADAVNELLQ